MVTYIETEAQSAELARDLRRTGRARPAAVVSTPSNSKTPFVDVDELDKAVGDDCDIYVIPTGALSFAFADGLPHGRQVYGGASRVYSVDNAWVEDQYRSALRFAFKPDTDRRVLNQLIEDAMTAVYAAGPPPGPDQRRAGFLKPVSGTVQGTVAGRVLIDVDGVWPAITYPDRLVPGVGADHLFLEGQHVRGMLDTATNVLHVESIRPASVALEGVDVETVLLARVTEVEAKTVRVEIYPDVTIRVPSDSLEEDLRATFTRGEVVAVEITGTHDDGLPSEVQVLPSSFADLAKPLAVLEGGPPWLSSPILSLPDGALESPFMEGSNLAGSPDPASGDQEVQGLGEEILRLQCSVERLELELKASRARAREDRQRTRNLEKELNLRRRERAIASAGLFADATDQFAYEVYVSWAERTTPSDKESFPWRKPVIGTHFLETLDRLHGVDRAKVVEVSADVTSGRVDTMSAREVHQLRTGSGGDDPPVTRAGGETCWRVYLQQKSPSARRLHFWRLADGGVELSSVRVHDDFRP